MPKARSKSPKRKAQAAPAAPAASAPATRPRSIRLGDALEIERRYVVDGVLTCMTDKGRFHGVQQIGSAEHLVLEDDEAGVRMIPIPTIAEIHLLDADEDAPARRDESDPSVA